MDTLRELLHQPLDAESAERLYSTCLSVFLGSGPEAYELVGQGLVRAAEAGVADAWVDVGRCRWNGWGFPADPHEALEDYIRAARLGSNEGAYVAAYNLHHIFQDRDELAYELAHQARSQDPDGRALCLLALMTYNGRGCPQDRASAVEMLQQASSLGDSDAMFALYALHTQGELAGNSDEALDWLRQAAERDQVRACYNLGVLHATGEQGVDLDDLQARQWFQRAASLGHPEATYTLGLMTMEEEPATARALFERAEAQGRELEPEILEFVRG